MLYVRHGLDKEMFPFLIPGYNLCFRPLLYGVQMWVDGKYFFSPLCVLQFYLIAQ